VFSCQKNARSRSCTRRYQPPPYHWRLGYPFHYYYCLLSIFSWYSNRTVRVIHTQNNNNIWHSHISRCLLPGSLGYPPPFLHWIVHPIALHSCIPKPCTAPRLSVSVFKFLGYPLPFLYWIVHPIALHSCIPKPCTSPRLSNSVSVFKYNNSYENPISHVVISINFSGYPPPFEYTYTRFVSWPSSVVYSIRYFQTSHMSFVADLHLTVTRPDCVTTPFFTFLLPIVLITFFFFSFFHWYTCANFTRISTSLFPMVFLLYRLI